MNVQKKYKMVIIITLIKEINNNSTTFFSSSFLYKDKQGFYTKKLHKLYLFDFKDKTYKFHITVNFL